MDTAATARLAAPRAMPSFIAPAAPGLPDPVVTYHPDNLTVERVEYRDADGRLVRENGPAYTEWYSNGVKRYEQWLRDGEFDRADGPAKQRWCTNGVKRYEEWYRDGKVDREDAPAVTWWHITGVKECEGWYQDTQLNRTDGPAYITWHDNGVKYYEGWYRDGELDRADGPAITQWRANGVKSREEWWRNGQQIDAPLKLMIIPADTPVMAIDSPNTTAQTLLTPASSDMPDPVVEWHDDGVTIQIPPGQTCRAPLRIGQEH